MNYLNKYVENVTNELIADGDRIIHECRNKATFTNRSNNLEDSYGSCVYYNGKEVVGSKRYVGQSATSGSEWYGTIIYGRTEIDEFFKEYTPNNRGWELLIAVAMPYGEVVENKYKYRVIAMSHDMLQSLVPKYKNNAYVKHIWTNKIH